MSKPRDTSSQLPDADLAKTYRHLRFMKALFEIDDPELERALAVIMDRLANTNAPADDTFSATQANAEPKSSQD
jgi:hypothetical protein